MFEHRRYLPHLVTLTFCWAVCAAGAGCQSLFNGPPASPGPQGPAAASKHSDAAPQPVPVVRAAPPGPVLIQPRTEVIWSIEPAGSQGQGGMTGKDYVGPDGKLRLGPYGEVKVAGMNPNQAAAAIQGHVKQVANNKSMTVRVRVVRPDSVARTTPPRTDPGEWKSQPAPQAQVVPASWSSEAPEGPELAAEGPPLTVTADGPQEKDKKPNGLKSGELKTPDLQKGPRDPGAAAAPAGAPPLGPDDGPHHAGPAPGHAPHEFGMVALPPYRIAPPDVLNIESLKKLETQPITGPHLVRPDGTVGLGIYGSPFVGGMTLEEAREVIARSILSKLSKKVEYKDVYEGLSVDVLAYNSRVYYVISDLAGNGDQVTRLPITGFETVLDAISLNVVRPGANGLVPVASKKHIWVARPGPHGTQQILPVDWLAITQGGATETNYQLLPGDRVYVKADCLRRINTAVDKFLSPIERILGATLLGSQTVNSIRSGSTSSVP